VRNSPLSSLKALFEERVLFQTYLRELRQQRTLKLRIDDDHGVELTVKFGAFLAYRQRDESYALRTNDYMRAESADHWIYKTEDSEFLDWF
jgi:CYTH domain-containing protein